LGHYRHGLPELDPRLLMTFSSVSTSFAKAPVVEGSTISKQTLNGLFYDHGLKDFTDLPVFRQATRFLFRIQSSFFPHVRD
jgi:hypothetical protein